MGEHLWEVEHPYYCQLENYYAAGDNRDVHVFESWQDFAAEFADSDMDYNLVFRWDWHDMNDPDNWVFGAGPEDEKDELEIFVMGQRKGRYTGIRVLVDKSDEDAVRAWLQSRFEHLMKLWAPFTSEAQRAREHAE